MDNKMTISVAMTTYNGEKYVVEQLQSILNQTRRPDEVIICDDISQDNTVNIVKEFIASNNLVNWYIFVNEKNLGWRVNFRNAISKTTGDIVFFSDQDDIWLSDKIEKMSVLMLESNAGCLYGHANIIDSENNPISSRNEKKSYTGKLKKITLKPSFYMAGALGCCMCVQRRVIEKYLQFCVIQDDHDSQCPRISVLYDTLFEYDAPVINYRIHQNNSSGISSQFSYGSSNLAQRIKDIEIMLAWLKRVSLENNNLQQSEYIQKAMALEKKRLVYLRESKLPFISLFTNYCSYSGLGMLIGDFAYKHNINKLLGKIRWCFRIK